ncbi:hypothetical protein CYMTET_53411 [Cymbomonas tetramitiformis]|uniref:Calmodulin n=1 Tax=Cymbomonas tetramitiformis TaxID=36881 RepID=A0AAE0EPR7_9CHLO|nr:hypothetical protein CYMTET_53411 [Cymbomonas tetramitiformis]
MGFLGSVLPRRVRVAILILCVKLSNYVVGATHTVFDVQDCLLKPGAIATVAVEECDAGTSCYPCSEEIFSCPDKNVGKCTPCQAGDYCPRGSMNEYGWSRAHLCAAGYYCEDTKTQVPCQNGYFCPEGTFAYIEDNTCLADSGYYCPEGSNNTFSPCPAGYYCPTPSEKIICPKDHYCRKYSVRPRSCKLLKDCEEGTEYPDFSIAAIALSILGVVFTLPFLFLSLNKKMQKKRSVHEERLKDLAARSNAISVLTSSLLGGQTGMVLGSAIPGFIPVTRPISISFQDLSLFLPDGRQILFGVDGSFQFSRVTAIMGPSGCGKSTLLAALCGRTTARVHGTVMLNSQPASISSISNNVGFVPQDDVMYEDLTVRENLSYSARLRLPGTVPPDRLREVIDGAMTALQITGIQNEIVGGAAQRGISGGQKKRVNIGMEVVIRPNILFLDEPTSGLSASDSVLIMKVMRSLSCLQCTVVSVIHQPRALIFEMFHDLMLLDGGLLVYYGPQKGVINYFMKRLNFPAPVENPADYLMDILNGDILPRRKLRDSQAGRKNGWFENRKGIGGILATQWKAHVAKLAEEPIKKSYLLARTCSKLVIDSTAAGLTHAKSFVNPLNAVNEDANEDSEAGTPKLKRKNTGLFDNLIRNWDIHCDLDSQDTNPAQEATGFHGGELSEEMIKSIFEEREVDVDDETIKSIIAEFDTDSDGTIDICEFIEYVNRLQVLKDGISKEIPLALMNEQDPLERMYEQRMRNGSTGNSSATRYIQKPHDALDLLLSDIEEMLRQLWWCLHRASEQWIRRVGQHIINIVLLFNTGIVVGYVLMNSTEIRDIPVNCTFSNATLAVVTSVAAIPYFASEIVARHREQASGNYMLSYFVAKNMVLCSDLLWQPMIFLAGYYSMIPYACSFQYYLLALVVMSWAATGIGVLCVMVFEVTSALMATTTTILVLGVFFGGVEPKLSELGTITSRVADLSYSRWATEFITVKTINANFDDAGLHYEMYIEEFYKVMSYEDSTAQQTWDLIMLVILGFVTRVVAYLAMVPDWHPQIPRIRWKAMWRSVWQTRRHTSMRGRGSMLDVWFHHTGSGKSFFQEKKMTQLVQSEEDTSETKRKMTALVQPEEDTSKANGDRVSEDEDRVAEPAPTRSGGRMSVSIMKHCAALHTGPSGGNNKGQRVAVNPLFAGRVPVSDVHRASLAENSKSAQQSPPSIELQKFYEVLDFFMDAALEGGSRKRKGGRVAADKRGTAHELAKQFARQLQAARVNLHMVQQRMIEQFDARHRLQQMKVNDQVWVDGQHLTLPVWSQTLRRQAGGDGAAPPPVMVVGQREREVERIISSRFRKLGGKAGGTVQEWLTKWKGLPHSHSQWKTREDLEGKGVDILPKWQATCTEDMLHGNYKLCPRHYFDVVCASPPCKEYCKEKTRGAPDLELADRRVQRTRAIIEYYDPANVFIENPAGDALRGLHTRVVIKGLPEPLLTTYLMDLISGLTARTDEHESEIQDTEPN